jgi:hypothetical protein
METRKIGSNQKKREYTCRERKLMLKTPIKDYHFESKPQLESTLFEVMSEIARKLKD